MRSEPFRIAVSDEVLTDLREPLARPRFPDEIAGSEWGYGSALGYIRELVAYWRDRYDWRAAEAQLNAFAQFRAEVGGLGIHFIHERGRGPAPLPLLITHGWPGWVAGVVKIIRPLTAPPPQGARRAGAARRAAPRAPSARRSRALGSPIIRARRACRRSASPPYGSSSCTD